MFTGFVLIASALGVADRVGAHSGMPAVARLTTPDEPGAISPGSFTLRWTDSDLPTSFGPASVDLFFSDRQRPTFFPGQVPEDLPGLPIARGIPEPDLTNAFVWRTATVATGAYFVWSIVEEPPEETNSIRLISYAPMLLHVIQPGDPAPISVMLTTPDNAFRIADESYVVRYSAFDPTRSGRVRLEAGTTLDGTDFLTIADDLPAVPDGSFTWSTRALPEGNWTLRATITDGCGRSFSAFARFFVRLTHPTAPQDAGTTVDAQRSTPLDARVEATAACGPWDGGVVREAGAPDAGADAAREAGADAAREADADAGIAPPPGRGCACVRPWGHGLVGPLLLLGCLLGARKPGKKTRMRASICAAAMLGIFVGPRLAWAQDPGARTASAAPSGAGGQPQRGAARDPLRAESGQVLTYYGLRKLELDASLADDEKAREWEAFIDRATEQVAYARSAVLRWREAGRIRLVEAADLMEKSPEARPRDREAAWKKVIELYPRSADARVAQKKVAFHHQEETRRLVAQAEQTEASKGSKVDRVLAWSEVVAWTGPREADGKKAGKRIAVLQEQLFKEAADLDRIKRVDAETRLMAWKDVLDARAVGAAKRQAEDRVKALETELGRGPGRGGAGR